MPGTLSGSSSCLLLFLSPCRLVAAMQPGLVDKGETGERLNGGRSLLVMVGRCHEDVGK